MTIAFDKSDATQSHLQMLHLQLNWLEKEMVRLRKELSQDQQTTAIPDSFASLSGVWAGIDISVDEINAARISIAEELL